MKKMNFVIAAAVMLLLVSAGCLQTVEEKPMGGNTETVNPPENTTKMFNFTAKYTDVDGGILLEKSVVVENGTAAFDALTENVEVEFETYEIGAFITGLGGVETPEGYYLAMYVNGEYAEKGISDYTVEEDMTIEWKQEEIGAFGA